MRTNEVCRLCTDPGREILPNDNLPLCQGHWNNWLDFIFGSSGEPPCAAHLIRDEAAS